MVSPTPGPVPSRPRGGDGPRPEARSAGTAERPGRNESLVDLVRFFQTQNMPAQPSTPSQPPPPTPAQPSSPSDTTTALPVAVEPKEYKSDPKQELKPFHRRLLQFAQRQKKESPPRSKQEEKQRQIDALMREGYLIPAPLPKDLKGPKEPRNSKDSLSRSLSKSKKDVENIGQPWLQAKADGGKQPTEVRRRLASLDLDDFGSMVDVAVSLSSEFDDSVPPPYQPSENISSQSSAVPASSSVDQGPQSIIRSASSLASTNHSRRNPSIDEQVNRPPSSAGSSARMNSQNTESLSRVTSNTPSNAPASVAGTESPPPSTDSQRRCPAVKQSDLSDLSRRTSTPTLKLFPDVAPPRKSSITAWRTSAVPRYQTLTNTVSSSSLSSQIEPSSSTANLSDESRKSSDVIKETPTKVAEPPCTGALAPAPQLVSEAKTSIEKAQAPKELTTQDQVKARPVSLSMGTLKAFPLPAPTRPLPSLPEAERAPSAPPQTNARLSIRPARSGAMSLAPQSSSKAVPEDPEAESAVDSPQILESRPATALGNVDAGGSIADDEESISTPSISGSSKCMSPTQYTARRRASSIRIPRMQDLPESRSSADDDKGQPLADSPILGHSTPTEPQGKRIILNGLQINSQVGQKNLPFGLPSPPPTASLPSAPPPSHPPPPPPGRAAGQRNYTAPKAAMLHSVRSMEAPPPPSSYRHSVISQSDSSRSSLRRESFPDSYQESRPESRPESPLPSSDDEVFGPSAGVEVSRRQADKQKAAQPTHRGRTMDTHQMSSHSRSHYSHSAHHVIPQSRSNPNLEKTTSPQSQCSMSPHRFRASQSSHRPQAPPMDHYLEDRVANLERQNQILQAALMAALNVGNKNPLESLSLDPTMMPPFPSGPFASHYPPRHISRPESWISSSRSSEHSGFDTSSSYREGRPNVKQLDNMIEDIESGWMSDKSSFSGARISRKR
ncbi:hypothetical protein PENARI_c036G08699 [Penicillium arizonense]|uniref:Uncharacterized protein n=1 Tax=Penicillium arizonense TaxID=1835702 RepID=A0A1F5L3M6_PENAI|nr:hypothetical protein PENARI_c036G08699 [Penicillium arizonense]OGE47834.1 hypothetical protein PENARI_c036G08699 [Penicillium arizonense]